jgi:hypothetical protein
MTGTFPKWQAWYGKARSLSDHPLELILVALLDVDFSVQPCQEDELYPGG